MGAKKCKLQILILIDFDFDCCISQRLVPNYCNGLILRVEATYIQMAPLTIFSLECNVVVFDLRGHTYCCGSERGSFHLS